MERNWATLQTRLLHTGLENYDHVELDSGAIFFAKALNYRGCPCCAIALRTFEHALPTQPLKPGFVQAKWLKLEICPHCGWWHFQRDMEGKDVRSGRSYRATYWELTHAVQTEIDLKSATLPIDLLQRHLARRWEDRKYISAQQAEDLVAALLEDHHGGRVTRLTANANAADGGIDLYLSVSSAGSIQRAVQVKRRIANDVESVKDVRNFVGSMVLNRADEGIFVTTASRFSKAALALTQKASHAKFRLRLELVDGERLLEMLNATNADKPVQLPPQVERDQEWRSERGHTILTHELFAGDLGNLPL